MEWNIVYEPYNSINTSFESLTSFIISYIRRIFSTKWVNSNIIYVIGNWTMIISRISIVRVICWSRSRVLWRRCRSIMWFWSCMIMWFWSCMIMWFWSCIFVFVKFFDMKWSTCSCCKNFLTEIAKMDPSTFWFIFIFINWFIIFYCFIVILYQLMFRCFSKIWLT